MSKPIGSIFFLFLFSMLLSNSEGHLKFADGKVAQNSSSWCIAKYSANDTELANIIVSVCYFLLDDCNIIQPGGSCFIPNTLINHASVVMNQFYAKIGRSYCSGLITVTDPNEKEDEIQIGFPTDVKHVAHIGSDDPSATAPSWMNEYKSESSQGTENDKLEEQQKNNSSSKGSKIRHLIPKSRHQSMENNESNDSAKNKQTRRHRSSDPSLESSSNHDSSSGGSRHSRRNRRGSNHGVESPTHDGMPPTATKPRRKSKMASSEDGGSERKPTSTRTSRRSSKGDSLTDNSFTELGSEK